MHNKLEDLKNKKFDIKHMLGSFFGGALVAVLVVYGVSGTQSQGYLRLNNNAPALNPAAITDVSKKPVVVTGGTCSVSNCDINAKLDLILNQVTIKNGGSQTLAAYIADQFTDTHNSFVFLGGQFTEADNMLTNILNNTDEIRYKFFPGVFTDMMNKLDIINSDTSTTRQYFMPGIFTDILSKLDQIIAK